VAKPIKHGDRWRIRWLDEQGKRQSAVLDDYKGAQTELRRHQVEVGPDVRGAGHRALGLHVRLGRARLLGRQGHAELEGPQRHQVAGMVATVLGTQTRDDQVRVRRRGAGSVEHPMTEVLAR